MTEKLEPLNRYLLQEFKQRGDRVSLGKLEEFFIMEISSTGEQFKARHINNFIEWKQTKDYKIIEKLPKN